MRFTVWPGAMVAPTLWNSALASSSPEEGTSVEIAKA
jgi:hypothetical protein